MPRTCAYCGIITNELTREHIIPQFVFRTHPDYNLGYIEAGDVFANAEARIKDVCYDCNSGPLSKLDAYAAKFCRENSLDSIITESPFTLRYDFHTLARWLLKVSFNSARATKRHVKELQRYKHYILNGEPQSSGKDLEIWLELIAPYRLTDSDREYLTDEMRGETYLYPKMVRISYAVPFGITKPCGLIRMVAINSSYFYLILYEQDSTPKDRTELRTVFHQTTGFSCTNCERKKTSVSIRSLKRTFIEAFADTGVHTYPQWLSYLRKKCSVSEHCGPKWTKS